MPTDPSAQPPGPDGPPGDGPPGEEAAGEGASSGPSPEAVDLAHALFDLARNGRTEQLTAYVDAGAPVDLTDPDGNTLLMLAAYHGHPDLVRQLAERGADVGRLNDRGQSPLAGAVFKGEDEVVGVLLAAGADPDTGTPTASETAKLFGRSDLLDRGGMP
ncbi:ankyrin repeat domain-containing protein [Ornithinimicrobium sp. W1679]|uniref:ankyrin repeat domain-containing protein n=1 Tax=unclassified Ornithinimicrobium TaxID=2615080 RepID=UPI003CF98667